MPDLRRFGLSPALVGLWYALDAQALVLAAVAFTASGGQPELVPTAAGFLTLGGLAAIAPALLSDLRT